MEREVDAVEPDVSKAEALDPEWADDELESRCLEFKLVFIQSFTHYLSSSSFVDQIYLNLRR